MKLFHNDHDCPLLKRRICCDVCYPLNEALYASVDHWLAHQQKQSYGDWVIALGRECPSDSTLLLTYPTGQPTREAAIESAAWNIMNFLAGKMISLPAYIPETTDEGNPDVRSEILRLVWDHCPDDFIDRK